MPKDIVFVVTSSIGSNTATEFTKKPVREIVAAKLIQSTHDHVAFTALGSSSTVAAGGHRGVLNGAGGTLAAALYIQGGATTSFTVPTSEEALGAKELTVVTDTPDASGEIQLSSETEFKCYDALSPGDILVLTVVEKGEYSGA